MGLIYQMFILKIILAFLSWVKEIIYDKIFFLALPLVWIIPWIVLRVNIGDNWFVQEIIIIITFKLKILTFS